MLAALAFGLALATSGEPTVLDAPGACRLAMARPAPQGQSFTIRATYFADGRHGAILELPGCDGGLFPQVEGDFLASLNRFHEAFRDKCGDILMGDFLPGVFTGYFVRRKAQLFGMPEPAMVDFFVVTGVESEKLDAASIVCPE